MARKNNGRKNGQKVDLKKLIDKYGEIDQKIKKLNEEKEKLKALLPQEEGTYYGERFKLTISYSERAEYDPVKVAKRLKKDFVKVVTVTSAVKKYIPQTELQEYIKKTTGYFRYSLKKIKEVGDE
ncbi:MAG: hypothetical protein DRH57_00120 [Candidatus Cloacimonadota bacterium]|nr:MAG: hypothetical protein DRH57_00120 [Candidatus Cloacimonadota bacterium]